MEFLTYKKYHEKERVDSLTLLLDKNRIAYQITEDRDSLDSLYGANPYSRYFFVKIQKADFAKADEVLSNESLAGLENVDNDHYLYDFTDEELFDILSKPDEWNEFDYHLARKILKEKGKEINENVIALLKDKRIKELGAPEQNQKTWIYAGYIFALLGGLLGIFIGWHLSTFKKTLPDGQRVFGYTQEDREHGTRILIIGVIMFVLAVGIRIARTDYYY
jgi:hypothetical protein